jgi:hypothetical protein
MRSSGLPSSTPGSVTELIAGAVAGAVPDGPKIAVISITVGGGPFRHITHGRVSAPSGASKGQREAKIILLSRLDC